MLSLQFSSCRSHHRCDWSHSAVVAAIIVVDVPAPQLSQPSSLWPSWFEFATISNAFGESWSCFVVVSVASAAVIALCRLHFVLSLLMLLLMQSRSLCDCHRRGRPEAKWRRRLVKPSVISRDMQTGINDRMTFQNLSACISAFLPLLCWQPGWTMV